MDAASLRVCVCLTCTSTELMLQLHSVVWGALISAPSGVECVCFRFDAFHNYKTQTHRHAHACKPPNIRSSTGINTASFIQNKALPIVITIYLCGC